MSHLKSKCESVLGNGLWVFALALLVRLLVIMQGYDGDPQDTPEYEEIAQNLLAGRGFFVSEWWYGFKVWSWRAPFYPFFLAAIYGIFGPEQWIVRVVQCIIGAFTVVLLLGIAKRCSIKAAPFCSGVAIFYGPLVVISNEVMTETWFIFWIVLGVYCLIKPHGWMWVLGGGAIGFAILTRPVGAFLLIAWVIFAWIRREDWRRALGVCVVAFVVLVPWIVRNYDVHQTWPVLSTQGGFIVARSNALHPDWKKEVGWDVSRQFLEKMPSELERDRYWWQQGKTFIVMYPGMYFRLVIERFVRLWYFFRPDYNFWWMLVLPVGCVGLWHLGLKDNYLLLSLFMGLSVIVFSGLLYGAARFRLPLEAIFLIFVGAGFRYLMDRWGWQKMMRIGSGVALFHMLVDWQDVWLREALLVILRDFGMK